MPTIEFKKSDLEILLNKKIKDNEVFDFFLPVKGEVDGFENNIIKLDEKDSNRPDLWSVEGIARDLKAHLQIDVSIPQYNFDNSQYVVKIDDNLKNIRPFGAYAIAKNVKITDDFLKSLIQIQEKITTSFGKKRAEVAIGIFDLDKINGKKLKYFASETNFKFIPLGFEQQMTLKEILEKHPKGKEFSKILKNKIKYPLLVDEKNNVLSMPPIINSNSSGKVTTHTKNLFIDVTGTNFEKVNVALLILSMALADRGAKVEKVKIIDGKKEIYTPVLKIEELEFDKKLIFDYFEELSDNKIKELLERKRYDVEFINNKIKVKYLNYRQDIFHPVDVIEDLLISYGFNKIIPEKINVLTSGSTLEKTDWLNLVREAALGTKLQEVMLFTLTSRNKQYKNILYENEPVEIANPMSEKIAIFREHIFPEHLEFLTKNQHISYPQNIFEVGPILELKDDEVVEKEKLTVSLCNNNISFTEIKQYLETILRNIGAKDIKVSKKEYDWFIVGRSAKVKYKLKNKLHTGFLGEIKPEVLLNFGLEMPVALFEIEIYKK